MSRVTKRKHVLKEMQTDDFELPKENQQIVRVVCSRGNNLHEVEPALDGENFLVSMPNKFRKNVWVKRGDFLVVDPIEEGDKVKAEIFRILTPEHVKEYTKQNVWPKKFTKKREREDVAGSVSDDSDSDNFLPRNVNRQPVEGVDDSSDDASNEASDSD